jgi:hypothetical protein
MSKYDDKWCVGENNIDFSCSFDTKEEAIQEGKNRGHDKFYIGICEDFTPEILPENIIEELAEAAYEVAGEHSDNFLSAVSKEQTEDLGNMLNNVLNEWMDKYKLEVDFYSVTDVEKIEV